MKIKDNSRSIEKWADEIAAHVRDMVLELENGRDGKAPHAVFMAGLISMDGQPIMGTEEVLVPCNNHVIMRYNGAFDAPIRRTIILARHLLEQLYNQLASIIDEIKVSG